MGRGASAGAGLGGARAEAQERSRVCAARGAPLGSSRMSRAAGREELPAAEVSVTKH